MHIACERREEGLLKLLPTYGADVNIISPNLRSTLHVACKSGDSGLAKKLLQHSANVNIFSPNHGTKLHTICTGNGCGALIHLLPKHGAGVNSKGSKRETLLTSILSQERYSSERLIESLLSTKQQLEATGNDLGRLMTGYVYSKSAFQICKRVLADDTHLKPTIETVRLLLAGPRYSDLELPGLLLARAPHLVISTLR